VSSYFGGKLLDYLSVRQMFIATSSFSILTLASGIIVKESDSRMPQSIPGQPCFRAKRNWAKVWHYLKLPFIYIPTLFIFLVVLAPGCDDAMFYFNTNVLHFSNTDLGTINVVCSVANILGVWTFRVLFKDTPFKKMLVLTTACLAATQLGKLVLTQ
jgi:Na+/melibiose symporter-like transporter